MSDKLNIRIVPVPKANPFGMMIGARAKFLCILPWNRQPTMFIEDVVGSVEIERHFTLVSPGKDFWTPEVGFALEHRGQFVLLDGTQAEILFLYERVQNLPPEFKMAHSNLRLD